MNSENNITPRGAARLRSLTDAAAELFLNQGYEAMSLDALITQVGGSRRNIYSHFGGKEGLFLQVVRQLCEDLAKPLTELKIGHKTERAALTLFGQRLIEIVVHPRALALHRLMVAEGARFPELAQAIYAAGHGNAVRLLSEWIQERQLSGKLREEIQSSVLATQLVELLVAGPQLRALVGLDPVPLSPGQVARLTKTAVDSFLLGAMNTESRAG